MLRPRHFNLGVWVKRLQTFFCNENEKFDKSSLEDLYTAVTMHEGLTARQACTIL
jgi:hypothetical protein